MMGWIEIWPITKFTHCAVIMTSRVLNVFGNIVRRYGTNNMPPCNFVPKKYTGPSYEKIEQIRAQHMPPAVFNIYKKPLLLHQGHMQWLYDHKGQRYLDLIGSIVTISVGHCHPKVVTAVQEQVSTLWHTTTLYRYPGMYEYIEKLAGTFPGDLKVVYLVNSGSDANDLAVLLARAYTGNHDVISLQGCYHGTTSGLQGLTSTKDYRMPQQPPAGFFHAMLPDPLRGLWGGYRDSLSQVPGEHSCAGDCPSSDKYVHQLEELIVGSMPTGRVAAFFAESIQGVNGCVQFPKGYIRKAHELIKKYGGLFVADEVQTGFGRTGDNFWCFESHGVTPDIVTMAKGIGNGFPMAAVVTTKEIAAAHTKASYFNTFGGNPLAAATGLAVLNVIEEEEMQKNSKEVGKYFIEQLMQLQNIHPVIGDVRGKGLMLGLEFVIPGTKEPLDSAVVAAIQEAVKDLGILIGVGGRWYNVLRIKPPMCVTKEDVDFTIWALNKAIKNICSNLIK